jgi:crossover junction endodeoxyribonuclease RuvC
MTMNALFERPANAAITIRAKRQFPAIAGVDLSMTSTGLAVSTGQGLPEDPFNATLHRVQSKPIVSARTVTGKPAPTWEDRRVRMADIVRRVTEAVPDGSLVFLEAPAYGATGAGTFDRSGLWWWVFSELTALECLVVPVSPAQRMLYATGKGGGKDAGKDAVIAAVVRRYPWADVRGNDEADALVLLAMARRAVGAPLEEALPAANLKALDKLDLTQLDA